MDPIIIVGSGLAGYTLAKEVRKKDRQTPITVISRDDGRYYSKPMLSNGLAKQKTADDLAMQSALEMAGSYSLTVLTNTDVLSIDTDTRRLTIEESGNQRELGYSSLVLGVGASQIALPIGGDAAGEIITVNDLVDYAVFRQRLESVSRVVLMGPGLIGCEFANDLINVQKQVTVIGPDKWPLERLMPRPPGEALKAALAEQGVEWILGNVVTEVNHSDEGLTITLDNGEMLGAELVLSAAGLIPNTELARAAGIETRRGIVTDQLLKTSAEDVYALGDCAEICGLVMPYVIPIMLASKALAKTLLGVPTRVVFPAIPVAVKTPSHPIVVSPPADIGAGEWQSEAAEGGGGVKSLFLDAAGNLLGFTLTGSTVIEKTALQRQLPAILPAD